MISSPDSFRWLRTLLVVAGLSAVSASAQVFVGSDDFSGSDGKWAYFFRTLGNGANNGTLTFTGSNLSFSSSGGSSSYFLGFDADTGSGASRNVASYTNSWIMNLQVTNTVATTGGEYTNVGIEIAGGSSTYAALMLGSTASGYNFRMEGSSISTTTVAASDNTDVWLRLAWDAGTQQLTGSYSNDGATYTTVATVTPSALWSTGNASTNGFNFEVFANSTASAAISSGMTADNFSITAVPEPSTYAALAGVAALGLAVWRRRSRRASA